MTIKHILSGQQFLDKNSLEEIFKSAASLEELDLINNLPKSLSNKIVSTLFYEPSTRTRLSFEAAVLKLGGSVISTESAPTSSSVTKGETLEDTIRVVSNYAHAIVLRHSEKGAAERAAKISRVPIINAGDGSGEHPTQALMDLYTIQKELGGIEGIKIAMIGDLLFGRTVHSLLPMLSLYHPEIYLISPQSLPLPDNSRSYLRERGINFKELNSLDVEGLDVLYVTRVQRERFDNLDNYEAVKNSFIVEKETLKKLKTKALILHPLPRVNEINPEVDSDPRAAYFRQAGNGLYVRMALLKYLIS